MCGICGIIDFSGSGLPRQDALRAMANAMSHRGPDADGFFMDGPAALGHRRLSILDLSDSANQPLTDVSGRYTIVFNGELYNFREVKARLQQYPFQTQGDTEVVLAAFAAWGTACVVQFRGMFAFAVWDHQEGKLWLCRDRMGVKPLYYHQEGDRFIFASEVRALLASGLVRPQLDRKAMYDYLSFQSFSQPRAPIEDVRQLSAGSWMQVCQGSSSEDIYWTPGSEALAFDYKDAAGVRSRIRSLLRDAVEQRLVSDVPVGAFLSGGIDSSVVVGMMAEVSAERPVTFNVSFSEKDFDESSYARLVADRFHTRHETLLMAPEDFLGLLNEALDAMDTPSADGPNTYSVSKAIRQAGIKVALSGVGGDELFAGYPFFLTWHRMARYRRLFQATSAIRLPLATWIERTSSSKLQRLASILSATRLEIAQVYPAFRRILPEPLIAALTTEPGGVTSLEEGLAQAMPRLERLPLLGQVSAAEYAGYTQHTLLKDTDQMSMAVSLEIREPFFDHALVDFMMHVPDDLRYPVYPKSLLVESVRPLLPDDIVHRRKQGFLFPWKHWMRGPLRGFCAERIQRHAERPFIRGHALSAYWQRFLREDPAVRWQELWQFVVLEHWMQKNGVQ
ncbi:MAG: asparagine synthase (glutamine-hydrolyzing) [Bacteroidetes bacterium]|nr:asparagine synthase (glutamine-hydrolyzing) [Bacteroidota bacterium]